MTLLFVTGNPNKVKEAEHLLGQPVEQKDIDLPEYQGDAEYVVRQKAILAYKQIKQPLFVEDTSVEFSALGGFPGPYIKALVSKNDISILPKMISAFDDKGMKGVAMIGYADEKGDIHIFRGEIEGNIVDPRGKNGFAWDSVFEPLGKDKTFAEMTIEEKSTISHRKRAFDKFKSFLNL